MNQQSDGITRAKKLNLLPYKFKDLFDYNSMVPMEGGEKLEKAIIKTSFGSGSDYEQTFYKILRGLPEIPASKTAVGIEIEVEMCPSFSTVGWNLHKEGSLRNNGKEFVSVPMEINAINQALAALYTIFRSPNVKNVDFSWRTSTHIHLDMRSATLEQLIRLILVYAIFEKILFLHIGKQRHKSIFCVPLTESWLVNGISKFISGDFSIGGLQDEWEKYSALNLFRLKDYGTVEFRHMGGTPHPEKISIWISLLVSLYNYAVQVSTDELINTIESLNTSSRFEELKEQVFGKQLAKILVVPNTKLIEHGVTFCKECLSKAYYPLKVSEDSALILALKAQKKRESPELQRNPKAHIEGAKGGHWKPYKVLPPLHQAKVFFDYDHDVANLVNVVVNPINPVDLNIVEAEKQELLKFIAAQKKALIEEELEMAKVKMEMEMAAEIINEESDDADNEF